MQPLVGKTITVVDATNPSLVDITGIVDNETHHTITIQNKTVHKQAIVVRVDGHDVPGLHLLGTHTRIRKG